MVVADKRKIWIDMLKGYGIIIVTLGHLGVYFPIEKHIYSYHMFLFFFISGYLYNEDRKFYDTLRIKTNHLLVPFFSWNLFSSIFGYIIYDQNAITFVQSFLMLNGQMCFDRPIWFIWILYLSEIIYAHTIFRNSLFYKDLSIMVVSLVLFFTIGTLKLPLKLNLVPLGIFTYTSGHFFKNIFDIRLHKRLNLFTELLLLISGGGACCLASI